MTCPPGPALSVISSTSVLSLRRTGPAIGSADSFSCARPIARAATAAAAASRVHGSRLTFARAVGATPTKGRPKASRNPPAPSISLQQRGQLTKCVSKASDSASESAPVRYRAATSRSALAQSNPSTFMSSSPVARSRYSEELEQPLERPVPPYTHISVGQAQALGDLGG